LCGSLNDLSLVAVIGVRLQHNRSGNSNTNRRATRTEECAGAAADGLAPLNGRNDLFVRN
jgi:hypothetical protein